MDETKGELDRIFRDLLASNRGPGYGVAVLDAAPDLSLIEVELRFIAGRRYCCIEPGCHLPHRIGGVIRVAAEHGIRLPADVVVRWHCRVEAGVEQDWREQFGLPVHTEGMEFEHVTPTPAEE